MLGNLGMDPINKPVTETLNSLHLQVGAGVSLLKSLKTCARVCRHPRGKAAFTKAAEQVEQRASFNEILKTLSVVLPYPEQAVLSAGWDSGKIEWALKSVVDRRELLFKIRKEVNGQLVVPKVEFFAVCLLVPLPYYLQTLMGLDVPTKITGTQFLVRFLTPLVVVAVVVTAVKMFQRAVTWGFASKGLEGTPPPTTPLDYIVLSAPVVSRVKKWRNRAEFASLMSNLLGAGLGMVRSLEICARALPNGVYRKAVARYSKKIREEGGQLAPLMERDRGLWPFEWIAAMEVGHESGEEDQVLARLGVHGQETYTTTVRVTTQILTKIVYLAVMLYIAYIVVSFYVGYLRGMGL